jgi:hypothetical protein
VSVVVSRCSHLRLPSGFRLHRTDIPSGAPVNAYERIASPTPAG